MTEIITNTTELTEASTPLEFLSEKGQELEEGNKIVQELLDAMEAHPECLALAAPQLGIKKRIFGLRFDDQIKIFIDPIITKKSAYTVTPETFISMPGKEILIIRPEEVTAVYYTPKADKYVYEENKFLSVAARLFDQQCQLLDGVLPDALGLVSDVEQDGSLANLTEAEAEEMIEFYKKYVQVKAQALRTEIEADPDTQKAFKQLDFTERVINGSAALVAGDGGDRKSKVNKAVTMSFKALGSQEKASRKAALKNYLSTKGK